MKPEYYAIDVVLVPEENVTDISIGINRKLVEKTGDSSISLGKNSCIPHISLAMCMIPADCAVEIRDALYRVIRNCLPYKASFAGYAVVETSGGNVVSGADIVRDEIILSIQDRVVRILDEFRSTGMTGECFLGDSSLITPFSIDYSENYFEKQTGGNFSPHITLGNGNVNEIPVQGIFPEYFDCRRIAICRLGNHCTCAEIIGIIE